MNNQGMKTIGNEIRPPVVVRIKEAIKRRMPYIQLVPCKVLGMDGVTIKLLL